MEESYWNLAFCPSWCLWIQSEGCQKLFCCRVWSAIIKLSVCLAKAEPLDLKIKRFLPTTQRSQSYPPRDMVLIKEYAIFILQNRGLGYNLRPPRVDFPFYDTLLLTAQTSEAQVSSSNFHLRNNTVRVIFLQKFSKCPPAVPLPNSLQVKFEILFLLD